MDITINPRSLQGEIHAISSKSMAHRIMICAAFADRPTMLLCPGTNRDMDATADCLRALGAEICRTEQGYHVTPAKAIPGEAALPCCESGSTLRFLLPVVGALGVDAVFYMEGRLPQRPLSPLWEEMERMGCTLTRPSENTLRCRGKLRSGRYCIDGGVSSQFITGLLLALSLMEENSQLVITGKIESRPYIALTKHVLSLFSVDPDVLGGQSFRSPGTLEVEGDWSNGAFYLAANAMGSQCDVKGLNADSFQGDRAVVPILKQLSLGMTTVDGADIPDLIPILSVVAACKHGAEFTNIQRLRLKESDRVASVCAMLASLGCKAEAAENVLRVFPGKISGGTVDACNDHRIAMAAAIASTAASGPVTILGAQCAEKSYPRFWADFVRLGGQYEQHIR